MKVLLADTDNENIKNFKTFIKNNFSRIKSIYVINNDTNYMRNLDLMQPDIMICDLRFFETKGYQQIIAIYDRFPNLPIILYGLYRDLEYMQKSLSYGVIEYIFRPVKPLELERCINNALKFVDRVKRKEKELANIKEEYVSQKILFENRFLSNVINGEIQNDREIKESFKYFQISITSPFRVFIVRVDHFQKVMLVLDEMEKHLLIYQINSIILNKIKKEYEGTAFINSFNMATAIIGSNLSLDSAINLCNEIRLEIKNKVKIGVTIGLGNSYEKESEIAFSYNEARAALRYRYLIGYDTVIPISFVEPNNNVTYKYPLMREEKLIITAVIGEYENCEKLLNGIFKSLRGCEPLSKELIQKIIMNIIISINRYATEQGILLGSQFTAIFPSKDVFALENLDEAYNYINTALKQFCDFIVGYREKEHFKLFEISKNIVLGNFSENISLNEVAKEVGTTPDFLNKLFKKLESKTFYDYLTDVRLDTAKKLLMETKLDEEKIAVSIGYENAKYFRSIFKQHTGRNTFEFRKVKY